MAAFTPPFNPSQSPTSEPRGLSAACTLLHDLLQWSAMAQDAPLAHVVTASHLQALQSAMRRHVACPHPLFEAVEGAMPTTGLLDGPLLLMVGLAQGGRLSEPAVRACATEVILLVAEGPAEVSPRGAAALVQLLQLLCEDEGEAAALLLGAGVLDLLQVLASARHCAALGAWVELHGSGAATEVRVTGCLLVGFCVLEMRVVS